MKECIFHFKYMKDNETKLLRGLIFLDDDKKPEITDFIESFRIMGYKVELENERELIFHSTDSADSFKLDVTKIEIKGEKREQGAHDGELRAILDHLIKRSW